MSRADITGKVIFKIPKIGYLFQYFKQNYHTKVVIIIFIVIGFLSFKKEE